MNLLEYFLDTKHKRVTILSLLFTVFLLKEAIANALIVFPILSYTTLESLYNLVPVADMSFIGRMLYGFYSLTSLEFEEIFLTVLKCFSPSIIFCIVMCFYYLSVNYCDNIFKISKRLSRFVIIGLFFIYGGVFVFVISNLTIMTTYYTILNVVRNTALWLLISHLIYILILLVFMYFQIIDMLHALEYKAIEVDEEYN